MPLPDPLITVSPDYMSGAPVFTGTRVPVKTLFDYLKGGHAVIDFLEDFPTVAKDHALAVLTLAGEQISEKEKQSRMPKARANV